MTFIKIIKRYKQQKTYIKKEGLLKAEGNILLSQQNNNHMRYNKVTIKDGIAKIHHTKGTHWTIYRNENSFDSPGWPSPENFTDLNLITNRK